MSNGLSTFIVKNEVEKSKMLFVVKGKVLKRAVEGIYSDDGNVKTIAVLPIGDAQKVTLGEILGGLASLVGMEEDVLKNAISSIISKERQQVIAVTIQEIFYVSSTDKNKKETKEYAIAIDIQAGEAEKSALGSLIELEGLSLAAWNTTREKELEKMNIKEILELLDIKPTPIA